MKNWYIGELYYVKVRRFSTGTPDRQWLGWLGLGTDDGYSSYRGEESTLPPQDKKILAVQWVGECKESEQPDQSQHQANVESTPRYLRAFNYPGGVRFLGGSGNNGFYCFWHGGDAAGGPGDNYELALIPLPGSNEFLVRRYSDNGPVYTYDDYYMGYWKDGNEFEITFEFIPAAKFSTKHENWMGENIASIGGRHLSKIVIPGSHDAGCSQIRTSRNPFGNVTSKTQGLEIHDQLMAGSRYFDLRAWQDDDKIWKIYHGSDWSTITLEHAVDQLSLFLHHHPNEIVMMSLLVEGKQSTFDSHVKKAWELVFDKLHSFHLNYKKDVNTPPRDFAQATPNYLINRNKNLLIFSWGAAESWSYVNDVKEEIFISPWSSGNGTHMDLDGVFVDDAGASAQDIYNKFNLYPRQYGQCWILHTNTPWQPLMFWDSIYEKHVRNTPQLCNYFASGQIGLPKANIINIDYVGDTVGNYNLVDAVIKSNF